MWLFSTRESERATKERERVDTKEVVVVVDWFSVVSNLSLSLSVCVGSLIWPSLSTQCSLKVVGGVPSAQIFGKLNDSLTDTQALRTAGKSTTSGHIRK